MMEKGKADVGNKPRHVRLFPFKDNSILAAFSKAIRSFQIADVIASFEHERGYT
jgi:hypothetical protein